MLLHETFQDRKALPTALHPTLKTCAFIVPSYNAASFFPGLQQAFDAEAIDPRQILFVDSMSTDHTRELVGKAGYRLLTVPNSEFRHGATRQLAAERMPWAEILIFLTQDALPCGKQPFQNLVAAFDSPTVGAAYGRQLPRPEAGGIERHARLFNYPANSVTRDFSSRLQLGFRTVFFSNSFSSYRRTAFDKVGGFPKDVIVSEEVTVAAKMLIEGWSIAYCANAEVIHSHCLSAMAECSRYFDIAVHHARNPWLKARFGTTTGEGLRFLRSEFTFLLKNDPALLPRAIFRTVTKWVSYQLGLNERLLPLWSKRWLTGQPQYWVGEAGKIQLPRQTQLLNR